MEYMYFLISDFAKSIKAVRAIFKTDVKVDIFIELYKIELSIIQKKYPKLCDNEAIKGVLLNAAYLQMYKNKSFSNSKKKKARKSYKREWLKKKKKFILGLDHKNFSYRYIKSELYYKYHYKVSHTTIGQFLKLER